MKLAIQNYPITLTATQLYVNVIKTHGAEIEVYYELLDDLGRIVEMGNKTLPKQVLSILAQDPIDLETLNTSVLNEWNITATEDLDASE